MYSKINKVKIYVIKFCKIKLLIVCILYVCRIDIVIKLLFVNL